jgi:hypothetical protein
LVRRCQELGGLSQRFFGQYLADPGRSGSDDDCPRHGALSFHQVSPFFHGVSLLQMAAWNEFSLGRISYHLGVLIAFALGLGLWALVRIRKKLIT